VRKNVGGVGKVAKTKVAVVGAGTGGLAAAMLLAADGYKVDVYESQPFLGGRNSRLEVGNYKFDTGPTFFMMPHILEEIFAQTGHNLHDYVELRPLDPMYQLRFGATKLDMTTDRDKMEQRIEHHFPGNGSGYRRYLSQEETKFDTLKPLLQRPFTSLTDYIALDTFKALPKLSLTETVYDQLSRYFTAEQLRYAFAFQAKYLGMSPWECPGAFTILSYLEHKWGLFHPIGGVNRLVHAMANVLEQLGGTIHLGQPVQRINTHKRRATSITLTDGSTFATDHVVINADFGHAATHLFEPGTLKKYSPAKLATKQYSCSTFMIYLGLARTVDLPHHTVIFADDYKQNVADITKLGRLSEQPSVYVHNPSALDPTLAPDGHSALYVLMPCPNTLNGTDWALEKARARELVFDQLRQQPELAGFEQDIVVEHIVTPADWQNNYHVHNGATFNLAHHLGQMMYFRPHNKFEEIDGVYLVGGGTHPGSGLPTILESARISAKLITNA
jgi:phytoene desaturase